jgi:hypothetical protein
MLCATILGLNRETVSKIYDAVQARIVDNIRTHLVRFSSVGIYEMDEACLKYVKLADGTYQDQL